MKVKLKNGWYRKVKDNNQKNAKLLLFLVLVLLVVVLLFLGFMVVTFIQGSFTDNMLYIGLFTVIIFTLTFGIQKLQPPTQPSDLNNNNTDVANEHIDLNLHHAGIDNTAIPPVGTPTKKGLNKNIVPLTILIVVFIIYFSMNGGLNLFGSKSIEGRWVYEMNEGETVNGVLNLTDYWYLEFYDDGTLDIGIKNMNFPEESEGYGTWIQNGDTILVTIHYDWGTTDVSQFVIRNNKLYDAETNVYSGYERD